MVKPQRFAGCFLAVVCFLYTNMLWADEADFPLPPTLVPAVNFWVKVYTQADTESGFLHDSENLNIIYEKLPRDLELIDLHRKQFSRDLRVLATGVRSNLSESQQHIMDLWGPGVTNDRLMEASDNIRWQLGQSDRYQEGLNRSGAYLPHIRAVARNLGMPEELASLPHVESSFHPGAFSSASASGMFQFMRETARRFMRVDNLVDERLDPYKSAYGAMKLLKENYDELHSWPLALTAYNHGATGMMKAVQLTGTKDIGEIVQKYKGPRFGFASRNFYAQFLAVRQVEKNADTFFGKVERQKAPKFTEIEMSGFVDAKVLAKTLGVTVQTLQLDNPALLKPVWAGNKRIPKGYIVKLDSNHFEGDMGFAVSSIDSNNFHTAQTIDESYIVQKGDSLSTIATRNHTSVSELIAINQLDNRHAIKTGQKLVLPQNGAVPSLVVNRSEQSTPAAKSGRYIVARGDTLSKLADRFKIAEPTLMALNNMQDANTLQPGQLLLLRPERTPKLEPATIASEIERSVAGSASVSLPVQTAALASMVHSMNPADYAVKSDGKIVVLPEETVGHYADWLRLNTKDLYSLNGLHSEKAVKVGASLKLDFSKVDRDRFESRRRQFHSNLQAQYFSAWRISETNSYQIKNSDSLAAVVRSNDIPMWLFRQYNPGVDASRLQAGQTVLIPRVERLTN